MADPTVYAEGIRSCQWPASAYQIPKSEHGSIQNFAEYRRMQCATRSISKAQRSALRPQGLFVPVSNLRNLTYIQIDRNHDDKVRQFLFSDNSDFQTWLAPQLQVRTVCAYVKEKRMVVWVTSVSIFYLSAGDTFECRINTNILVNSASREPKITRMKSPSKFVAVKRIASMNIVNSLQEKKANETSQSRQHGD